MLSCVRIPLRAVLVAAMVLASAVCSHAQKFNSLSTVYFRSGAQTSVATAVPDQFAFTADATLVRPASVSASMVTTQGRDQLSAVSTTELQFSREFTTETALRARYPDGNYRFSLSTSPNTYRTLVVPKSPFPSMCRVLNLDALQDVVNPSWTEISWTGFQELLEHGLIFVFIEATDGSWYLKDSDGSEGMEVGGSGGLILSLPADKTFNAVVQFVQITSTQTITGVEGPSFTAAASETRFTIRTRPTDILPNFTRQPNDVQALDADTIEITAEATGLPAPSFRWEKRAPGEQAWSAIVTGDGPYGNVTSASLSISRPGLALSGTSFRCVATNASGAVVSQPATLTVHPGYHVSTLHTTMPGPWNFRGPAVGPGGVLYYISDRSFATVRTDGTWTERPLTSSLAQPHDLAIDPEGNVYVSDFGYSAIYKISPEGAVTPFAGEPLVKGSNDGKGTAAHFQNPSGLCMDFAGNLFVADYWNHVIRRIAPDGTVTTVAGLAGAPGSTDGAGSAARFYLPSDVAVDAAGFLYVADTFNYVVRKISPNGVVSTLAGRLGFEGSADGLGAAAELGAVHHIAADPSGVVFIGDRFGTLRRITPDGFVLTVAGNPYQLTSRDGLGRSATFPGGPEVAFGPGGVLYSGAGDIRISRPWTEFSSPAQPASLSVEMGSAGSLGGPVTVSPAQAITYQWYRNGRPIAGETQPTLSWSFMQPGDAGLYVLVTSAGGMAAHGEITRVSVPGAMTSAARVLNLSTRSLCRSGDSVLIPGFVIEGTGTKRLLIRAVGPGLVPLGVRDVLADPRIVLKRYTGTAWEDVASNDNWMEQAAGISNKQIAELAQELGAFDLAEGSADAALVLDLPPGQYTTVADGADAGSGVALVELYDAAAEGDTSRLINLSNRGHAGHGDEIMIPGFVISPDGPRTLLVRAVGPSLTQIGVSDPLANPRLDIYRHTDGTWQRILSNDDWTSGSDPDAISALAAQLGAFALDDNSKDAALVATLPPGNYSVHASSADETTGVVLVELYLAP